MKKYLSIAALLAAGTLVSNAATWTSTTTASASNRATASGFWFQLDSTYLTTTSDPVSINLAGTVILDEIVLTWRDASGTGSNGAGVECKFVLEDAATNSIVAVSTASATATQNGTATIDFGDKVQISSTAKYNVWFVNPNTTLTAGNTFTWTADTSDSNNIVAPGIRFASAGTGTASSETMGVYAIGSESAWNANALWMPVVSIKTSSVPEPSAFGLLAGLGALALVASRRRRK